MHSGRVAHTAHMAQSTHTNEPDNPCPMSEGLHRAIQLLGDTWTLMIVYNLIGGAKRFGELLEAMGNVSPKTLSQRLKLLESIQFVSREAFAEIPPRVEYRLTEKGYALLKVMQAIQQFGETHLDGPNLSENCPSSLEPASDASA